METTSQKGKTQTGAGSKSAPKRVLVKVVAWILAVPALCALVVLGGAAPIYLLLPDVPSQPVQQDAAAVNVTGPSEAQTPVRTAAAPSQALPVEEPAGSETVSPSVADDIPVPAEDMEAEQEAEVSVVPTPRPAIETASLATAAEVDARLDDRNGTKRDPPGVSSSIKAEARDWQPQRRSVTIRPVALRSSPAGREIKPLGRGVAVSVGPCKDWCEVKVDGVAGWLHPSFLVDVGKANAGSRAEARSAPPRPAVRRDGYRAIGEGSRPYRPWRADVPERYGEGRWPAEEREPIEYYGYE